MPPQRTVAPAVALSGLFSALAETSCLMKARAGRRPSQFGQRVAKRHMARPRAPVAAPLTTATATPRLSGPLSPRLACERGRCSCSAARLRAASYEHLTRPRAVTFSGATSVAARRALLSAIPLLDAPNYLCVLLVFFGLLN